MKKQASGQKAGAAVRSARQNVSPLMAAALQAARLVCDDYGDSPAAREDMKRDVLATPSELLVDLAHALADARVGRLPKTFSTTTPKECNP